MQREPFVDAFRPVEQAVDGADPLAALTRGPVAAQGAVAVGAGAVELATLHGFDLDERAIVSGIAALPGELVVARSTVPLRREALGFPVVIVFEHGDPRLPIVLGVIGLSAATPPRAAQPVVAQVDDAERLVLRAEREIVLECGDASITLTRAGKVLIRGHYILSRASGYNRIKGAAIDIN